MKDTNSTAKTVSTTLKICGMSCAVCANRIEKGLAALPGVERAGVNFAVEKASIDFDEKQISLRDIAAKIEDLGYQVIKDKVELNITGMSCAACSTRIEKALKKCRVSIALSSTWSWRKPQLIAKNISSSQLIHQFFILFRYNTNVIAN